MSIPPRVLPDALRISTDGVADRVEERAGAVALGIAGATALVCGCGLRRCRSGSMRSYHSDRQASAGIGHRGRVQGQRGRHAARFLPGDPGDDAAGVMMRWPCGCSAWRGTVFTWCLFRFVSRQKPAGYGLVAMLLPSLTAAGSSPRRTAVRHYSGLHGCGDDWLAEHFAGELVDPRVILFWAALLARLPCTIWVFCWRFRLPSPRASGPSEPENRLAGGGCDRFAGGSAGSVPPPW